MLLNNSFVASKIILILLLTIIYIQYLQISIMKKKGKQNNIALMRTSICHKYQAFSHKRLLKQFEQIQNQPIPIFGVVARPLENNLFIWHGNLAGPKNSLYFGGLFHFQMRIPLGYPFFPPTITMYTRVPHPNIFNKKLCLDILELKNKEKEGGWQPVYNIRTILTQLQGFLYQEDYNKNIQSVKIQIKKSIIQSNSFSCNLCQHGGKIDRWPSFSQNQQQDQAFVMKQRQNQLFQKELVCLYTRCSFYKNPLGLSLSIVRDKLSCQISQIQVVEKYISLKAFFKKLGNLDLKIRQQQQGQERQYSKQASHWFPLYFGKNDNEQRFEKLLTKSLSMIVTNSNHQFKTEQLILVVSKLIDSLIAQIINEKHTDVDKLRIFHHIHSTFLFMNAKFPQISQQIGKLTQIIKCQKTKNISIDQAIAVLVATNAYSAELGEQILNKYFISMLNQIIQQLVQQYCQITELFNQNRNHAQIAQIIEKIIFQSSYIEQCHKICVLHLFMQQIYAKQLSQQKLVQFYNDNYCKLTSYQEQNLHSKIHFVKNNVKSFDAMLKYFGWLVQDKDRDMVGKDLFRSLIDNIFTKQKLIQVNNRRKIRDQIKKCNKTNLRDHSHQQFFEINKRKLENKQVIYSIKQKEIDQQKWKELCLKRWAWIQEQLMYDGELSATYLSALNFYEQTSTFTRPNPSIKLSQKYKCIKFKNQYKSYQFQSFFPQTNWKQLYLRLDLQHFLSHFNVNPDFQVLYQKLQVCKYFGVNALVLKITDITELSKLKSKYYYMTTVISKLLTLQMLGIASKWKMHAKIYQKLSKSIMKGVKNLIQTKGILSGICFFNVNIQQNCSQILFQCIKLSQHLKSLKFQKVNLFQTNKLTKNINDSLMAVKNLRQLVFIKCKLSQQTCKLLADSLMRSKCLQIFKIQQKTDLKLGLSTLIYNLTFFSPNLKILDISCCIFNEQVSQSLAKMIKISNNLELLILKNMENLWTKIQKQFFYAVGQSKSLKTVDFSYCQDLKKCQCKNQIGIAIGFNALKGGKLDHFILDGCIQSERQICDIKYATYIDNSKQKQIYGTCSKKQVQEDSNDESAQYYNNLKTLDLNKCQNIIDKQDNYSPQNSKKYYGRSLLWYVYNNKVLEALHLSGCKLQSNAGSFLLMVSNYKRYQQNHIKIIDISKNNLGNQAMNHFCAAIKRFKCLQAIDLSRNNIGVAGAVLLAQSMPKHPSLKYLNFFANRASYEGAVSFADNVIGQHPSLQFLELGDNKIKDKGFEQVIWAAAFPKVKNSQLKYLGLKFNGISNKQFCSSLINISLQIKEENYPNIFLQNNKITNQNIKNEYEKYKDNKKMINFLNKISIFRKMHHIQSSSSRTIMAQILQNRDRKIKMQTNIKQNSKQKQKQKHKCRQKSENKKKQKGQGKGKNQIKRLGQENEVEEIDWRKQLTNFYEIVHPCGIVVDARIKTKDKYQKYAFVQFGETRGVELAIQLAQKNENVIKGVRFNAYPAGNDKYLIIKSPSSYKKQNMKSHLMRSPHKIQLMRLPQPKAQRKVKQEMIKSIKVSNNRNQQNTSPAALQSRYKISSTAFLMVCTGFVAAGLLALWMCL